MHRFAIFITLMVLCCAVASSYSATIHVPSQQPTIQAGINAAVNGDTVLVAPGVYSGNIQFFGKRLVLASSGGAAATSIVAASASNPTVSIQDHEPKGTKVIGFTIRGGSTGVLCLDSSPDLINNIIENNSGESSNIGGGISLLNTSGALVKGNLIRNNAGSYGPAIDVGNDANYSSNDTICFNIIYENVGIAQIRCLGAVDNCKIYNNTILAPSGYGLSHQGNGSVDFRNNIVIGHIYNDVSVPGVLAAEYNDVIRATPPFIGLTPGQGNISEEPLFQDEINDLYNLTSASPCINAGDPNPIFNDLDGTRNDMGALPFGRSPRILSVPDQFATIQAAIDSAIQSDTILVLHGIYSGPGNVDLNPHGKSLTILGSGPDSTIIDCLFDGENHRGIWLRNGELKFKIQSLSIRNGIAPMSPSGPYGGAILVESEAEVEIDNCFLQAQAGGVVHFAYYGSLSCTNSSADGNGEDGIVAFVRSLNFVNVRICNSTIGLQSSGDTLQLFECEFVGNGIGASFAGCRPDIYACRFDSNLTHGAQFASAISNIRDCSFAANSGPGASFTDCGTGTTIVGCRFANNQSSGIYVDGSSDPMGMTLGNCTFQNNSSQRGGAIACWYDIITIDLDSCTFYGNSSPLGAVFYLWDRATFNVRHSVIAYNSGDYPVALVRPEATFSLNCTNIFGNSVGDWVGPIANQFGTNGNFSDNPRFCDTASGDFHIAAESPCAPANNSCNQQIGAFGVACSVEPGVAAVGMENEALTNVLSPTPKIQWAVSQPVPSPQDSFLIAVGTDNDWQFAEKWNPAPFASSDTFVTYDGSALLDGQTYYLRLRVHNTLAWSDWYQASFRMNSVPSAPLLRAPTNLAVVGSTPILWLTNGTDAEADPLTYEFAGFHDTDCVAGPDINLTGVAQTADSTGGQIVDPLAENCRYFWRARAYDGFEYSAWTDLAQFLVNGTPEAPTAPSLDYPPLPDNKPIFTLLPTLAWQPSYDPDPSDTVRYKLELSDRANFSFALVRDSLFATDLPLVDSLVFGTHYYWRVTSRDKTGLGAVSSVKEFWTWKLGDMNHSHSTDLSDLSLLIAYLVQTPRPDISPKMLADLTGDCKIDLSDLSLMISFMTTSGIQLQLGCE